MNRDNYTSIFGVGFLDDLHNYFPDLLYNQSRFTTVPQLLEYMNEQTRNRFNLLDYGRRMHTHAVNNSTASQPITSNVASATYTSPNYGASGTTYTSPNYGASGTTYTSPNYGASGTTYISPTTDISGNSITTPVRVQSVPVMQSIPRRRPTTYFEYMIPESQDTALMTSLLNLIQHPIRNFSDVVVFPTNQQINAATTVEIPSSTLEDACTICQDDMEAGTSIRRINRCNHSFHSDCIMHWFEQSCYCPICRTDIRE